MRHSLASFPPWKALLGAVYLSLFFCFVVWLFNSVLVRAFTRVPSRGEMLLGLAVAPLYLSVWWASRMGNARMLWLSDFGLSAYLVLLSSAGAIRFLAASLLAPWDGIVAGLHVFLALTVLGVSLVALRRGRGLFAPTVDRLWIIAALFGGGGAEGALLGMYASRYGKLHGAFLFLGILFSILSLVILMGSLDHLWRYRPWAKDEEQ